MENPQEYLALTQESLYNLDFSYTLNSEYLQN